MGELLKHKDILDMSDLENKEIELIMETARSMEEILGRDLKKVPSLRGKTIINLFFEPSTRTRTSFEIAGKRLSADVVNFTSTSSSVNKGETLLDTARNIEAMKPDILVVRHQASGAPHFLGKRLKSAVINAGDGQHEHPTQGLLDIYTLKKVKGNIKGLNILIVGDVLHSRVARSDVSGFIKMGARVTLCGPPTLIPRWWNYPGVEMEWNIDEAVKGKDVIIVLRIQLERMHSSFFPSIREYVSLYGMNRKRFEQANSDAIIMHPGPINRGWELTDDLADCKESLVIQQVESGVAVRMALLYLLSLPKDLRDEPES